MSSDTPSSRRSPAQFSLYIHKSGLNPHWFIFSVGGNGLVGTVVKLCDWDDRPRSGCTVQWVLGTNNYRLGFNGYVDVRVVRTSGSNTCYYKTHLPALEIGKVNPLTAGPDYICFSLFLLAHKVGLPALNLLKTKHANNQHILQNR